MTQQPPINTTTADIAAWREDILGTLRRSHGYASALEADAENQRSAETQWLSDEMLIPAKSVGEPNAVAVGPPTIKNYYGPDVAEKIIESGADLAAAPETVSYAAKHLLFAALNGTVLTRDARREPFCARLAAGTDEASIADMRHEAVIGIFGTNVFRMFIPNFPFVYAYVQRCQLSVSGDGYETARAAAASPRRGRAATPKIADAPRWAPGLIVENIELDRCVTLGSALDRLSAVDFYAILVQIIMALKFAYERVGFTHYDLHVENVILRGVMGHALDENRPWFYIPYDAGRTFVAARCVATFTDFGFSHALLQNSAGRQVCFGFSAPGRASLVELGIFRDRPNCMTDIYRLLLTAAVKCRGRGGAPNGPLFTEIAQLVQYFNQTESLETIIDEQHRNFYYLPLTTHSRAYNFDDFLSLVKKSAKPHVVASKTPTLMVPSTPRRHPVLLSGSGFMDSEGFILHMDPLSCHHVPTSFAAFFDVYSSLNARALDDASRGGELARELREYFTKSYMRGYVSKSSTYNRAIATVSSEAARLYSEEKERFAEESSPCAFAVARSLRAAAILMETRRAVGYAFGLYWGGGRPGPPPDAVSVLTELDDLIVKVCELVAAAEARLADAPEATPETRNILARMHAHAFSGVHTNAASGDL